MNHDKNSNLVFAVSISIALAGCGDNPDRLEEPVLTTQEDVDLALMLFEMAGRIEDPFGLENIENGGKHDE